MTAIAFLILTRGAGARFAAMAQSVAAVARPGDEVVLVDDGSQDGTVALLGWFTALHGFGADVAITRIVTGADPLSGSRIGHDLAAPLAVAAATVAHVVFVLPGAPLQAAPFQAARALAAGADCVLPVPGPAWTPSLSGAVLRRAALTDGAVAPGPAALDMLWQALQGQATVTPEAFAAPVPLQGVAAVRALARIVAATHSACGWALRHLPAMLAGHGAGEVSALLAALAQLHAAAPAAAWQRVGLTLPGAMDATALHALRHGAPATVGRAALTVWAEGAHQGHLPLLQPALAPLWQDSLRRADAPADADLVLFAHPLDVERPSAHLVAALQRRPRPVALLSASTLWNMLFNPDPLAPQVTLPAGQLGAVRCVQINHHTSALFDFDRLPYTVMTDHRLVNAYAARFARQAGISAAGWRDAFAARKVAIGWLERAPRTAAPDRHFAAGDMHGLTGLAARLQATVPPPLPDHHLTRLVALDGQMRAGLAIAAVHQPAHLPRSMFDAFAIGARPVTVASPGHGLHALGLPAEAWINLWGVEDPQAGVADARWDDGFFRAYAQAQGQLATLFGTTRFLVQERTRMQRALLADLTRAADQAPV